MRSLLVGCALLIAGTTFAEAQPYYGDGGPPPPPPPGYGYGFHRPPPPPPPYGYGYGYRPRRHCTIVEGYYGPRRVCRW